MLNIASILFGLLALFMAIPSTIPFLGWGNWFVLPVALVGLALGAMSSRNSGRNLCLIVLLVAILRLTIGGGLI